MCAWLGMKEKTIGQSGPGDSPSPARREQHLPVCQEGLRNWERSEEAEGPGWGPRDSRAEMRFMTEASGPAELAWWRPVSKSPERPDNGQVNKSARQGVVAWSGKAPDQVWFRRELEGGAKDKQTHAVPFNSASRRLRQGDQTFRDNLSNSMRPYSTY